MRSLSGFVPYPPAIERGAIELVGLGNVGDGHAVQEGLDGPNPQLVSGVRCFLRTFVVKVKHSKVKTILQIFCRGPYRKEEAWRNVVANRGLFEQLNSHPFKWESRTHYESSEDAMSACVLLSFKEAGLLHLIVHWITGQAVDEKDVELFMWGISVDSLQPLDLLIAARNRFERGLPQGRPASEPDIMLRVRGKLFLILEARFGSHNSFVIPGEGQKSPISLTHDEVLNRYNDLSLKMLDLAKGKDAPVPQQLWQYAVLGEWMTTLGDPEATFYLVNLVRKGHEVQSQDTFRDLIQERFQVLTWEDLYTLSSFERKRLARLRCYLENKSIKLRQAFDLGRKWA